MHRFYLPPEHCQGEIVTLEGREAHHGLHVLRVRPSQRVLLLDGAGREYEAEVEACSRQAVRLRVLSQRTLALPPWHITLAPAVPKAKSMDWLLQKAVELGVSRITPLLTERALPDFDRASGEAKAAKWRLLAIEAMKQCGIPWLPQIEAPLTLPECLARHDTFDLSLLASLQPEARHPRHCFQAFRSKRQREPNSLCFWVGPEGDFTPAEAAALRAAGAQPVTLGPFVLRAETAALACLALANYELRFGAGEPEGASGP